jgi:hypothetical protein
MKKHHIYHQTQCIVLLLLMCFVIGGVDAYAQSTKRYKGKKQTSKREIRKKQDDAIENQAEDAPFAPKKAFEQNRKDWRDDQMWKSQTAGIIYPKAGNLSLVEPSKYALNKNFQLEAILPLAYHTPNLFGKYLWYSKDQWHVASRHGVYSATSGLRTFQKQQMYEYVDSGVNIPLIVSFKNELIVSRSFTKAYGCAGPQPYLILTGSAGLDFGIPLGNNGLSEIDKHFIANRSPALTGTGKTINVLARGDYKINAMLQTGASLRYFHGDFTGNNAFENKAWLETLINPQFGFSVGYALSWANYHTPRSLSFMPTFDLCWYFGTKKGHSKGLFDTKMF